MKNRNDETDDAPRPAWETLVGQRVESTAPRRPARILVVDDDDGMRRAHERLLRSAGHEVQTAEDVAAYTLPYKPAGHAAHCEPEQKDPAAHGCVPQLNAMRGATTRRKPMTTFSKTIAV